MFLPPVSLPLRSSHPLGLLTCFSNSLRLRLYPSPYFSLPLGVSLSLALLLAPSCLCFSPSCSLSSHLFQSLSFCMFLSDFSPFLPLLLSPFCSLSSAFISPCFSPCVSFPFLALSLSPCPSPSLFLSFSPRLPRIPNPHRPAGFAAVSWRTNNLAAAAARLLPPLASSAQVGAKGAGLGPPELRLGDRAGLREGALRRVGFVQEGGCDVPGEGMGREGFASLPGGLLWDPRRGGGLGP